MKNLVCLFAMLTALGTEVTCQEIGLGGCPNVAVKQDLDVSKYVGRWYEIEKTPVVFERGLRCVTAVYEDKGDYIKVTNAGVNESEEEKDIVGKATIPNRNESAKLVVTFDNMHFSSNYWVLDTDYTQYSLVYSCFSPFRLVNAEFIWILSRNTTLENTVKERLYKFLDDKKITRSRLEATLQNC